MNHEKKQGLHSILFLWVMVILMAAGSSSAVLTAFLVYYRTSDTVAAADARLFIAAEMAREIVGPDYHDRIDGPLSVSGETFEHIVRRNDDLCRRLGLQYIWSVLQTDNRLVFTCATHSDITDPTSRYAAFFDAHNDPESFAAALAPGLKPAFSSFNNEWGQGRQVLIPRRDARGRIYIFGASVKLTEYDHMVRQGLLTAIAIGLTVMGCALLPSTLLARRLTSPVTQLTESADRMATGDLDAPLPTTAAREIQSLSHSLDRMRQALKQQMTDLRESEERFRLLIESAPVSVLLLQKKKFIYGNPASARLLGFENPDYLIGLSALGTIAPEFRDIVRHRLKRIESGAENPPVEVEILQQDGGRVWANSTSVPVLMNSEPTAIIVCQDITERKQLETARAEQQALLEAIYRNAPLVLMVLDHECRVLQINGFIAQFVGNPAVDMPGRRCGDVLCCLHAHDVPKGCGFGMFCQQCVIRSNVRDTIEQGSTHLHVEAACSLLQAGETLDLTFLISTTPITIRNACLALVTMQNITETRKSEKERETLRAQLTQAQKMESVGRLAGGVAHDFNNMLQTILGYTEMAMDDVDPGSSLRESLLEIQQSAERSANLTRQLLAFARKQTISPKILDLNETVEGMLKMLRRLIGENIGIGWFPKADLWPIRIDPSQIDQILANLCVNARDAIAGVGNVTIETENISLDDGYCAAHMGCVPGDYVLLSISDDGSGMDPETLANIFEPFFTTKEIGRGTGLGLATVYGIVKQNNGFITVYSEPGQGTTFKIYLPGHVENEVQIQTGDLKKTTTGGCETILAVEDDPAILNMTRLMLEKLGYRVLAASRPDDAIRLAHEHAGALHLLITDVVMPEMNGRDLAKNLQSIKPDCSALFMSGYTANVIAHQGVLDPGVHFIQKPFSLHDLADSVRKALTDS